LLAVTIAQDNPIATWLLLIPVATLYFSYRAYSHERQKHESIESLYETSRMTHGTLKVEDAMRTLLAQACEMFRADMAMITMFPAEKGGPYLRTTHRPGKASTFMQEMDMDPARGVWARVAAEEEAVLVSRPIQNDALRQFYEDQGIKDAMVAPLHGDDKVVGVIHVCNRLGDVTTFTDEDLKLFETLVNHASVSLENARLVGKLEDSLAHLTEMNRLKDDFVASVSHELRTPLTSIRGYIKTLLRSDANFSIEEQRTFLETVDRQSNRLHRLIEDLLAVSRIESETDSTLLAQVSLHELTVEVADELRSKTARRKLDIDVPADLPSVKTDPGKVHQIVLNLIDNALKYAPEKTTVTVVGAAQSGGVTISVIDEGEGIPAEFQERIFDRFYQVDQSTTRMVGGTGLGLYICRRMAEAIGGRVWLENSDEDGSTFSLWIPTQAPLSKAGELARSLN
jgi:K+-sensing histidine kinase KdpD